MMMSRDKIEDKLEELIAASRLNELLNKKEAEEEKKKSNCVIAVLAVIGAVYRYFTPDYLEDFDDDDFEDDDFEEDDFEDED